MSNDCGRQFTTHAGHNVSTEDILRNVLRIIDVVFRIEKAREECSCEWQGASLEGCICSIEDD